MLKRLLNVLVERGDRAILSVKTRDAMKSVWGRPGHRLDVLSETQKECYGATLLRVKTGTSQGKSTELKSKTILLLLKDEGRNEKGQILKLLIDLN